MKAIHDSIISTIGNTPLVRLNRTAQQHGAFADILLKLEFFNPLSSVKDRVGAAMIDAALESGAINKETVLIDRPAATRASRSRSWRPRAASS